MTKWSQLEQWQPILADIKKISHDIFKQFINSTAAKKAKEARDDWLTHTI
jgi:hypothetical protein